MFRMGHHLLKAGLGVSGENALHHLRGLQQRRAMKVCRSTPTKQWELQRLKLRAQGPGLVNVLWLGPTFPAVRYDGVRACLRMAATQMAFIAALP